MEDFNVLDSEAGTSRIELSTQAISHIQEAAKWGNFLAIVGFVMIGFMVILGLFMGTIMGSIGGGLGAGVEMAGMGALMTVVYLLIAALYLYPTLKLYGFSKKAKLAIARNDSQQMTESMENLKSMFKFMGILMAIIIGFYAVMLVVGLIAGVAGGL